MKKIIRKSYPSSKAFKAAIRAFLDKHPGADELKIANGVRSCLQETCKAIDELVATGLIEPVKNGTMKKPRKKVMKHLGTGNIWFGKLDGQPVGYYRVSLSDKAGNPTKLKIGKLGAWLRVRLWAEILDSR